MDSTATASGSFRIAGRIVHSQSAGIVPSRLHPALSCVVYQTLEHVHGILRALRGHVVLDAVDLDALIGSGEGVEIVPDDGFGFQGIDDPLLEYEM